MLSSAEHPQFFQQIQIPRKSGPILCLEKYSQVQREISLHFILCAWEGRNRKYHFLLVFIEEPGYDITGLISCSEQHFFCRCFSYPHGEEYYYQVRCCRFLITSMLNERALLMGKMSCELSPSQVIYSDMGRFITH